MTTTRMTLDDALALGVRLHQSGNLDDAEHIYRQVLSTTPENVDALHFLGIVMHQRNQIGEALELVGRAVALSPDHTDARNNLGNMLHENERLEDAEEQYRAVLDRRPDHAGAQTNLGIVLKKRGDQAAAEAAFRRAIEIDPDHGEAYHNLGNILRDTGRSEEALKAFQRALVLRPYESDSYRYIGALLSAMGRLNEAAEVYQRWIEIDPKNPVPRHLYAACSARDIPERASDAFVKQTFDGFAKSFDETLQRLSYRAPQLVTDALGLAVGTPSASLNVLDAGAGTGLCGPLLRPYAKTLIGVDLSAAMLEKAAARGCYDNLHAAELTAFLGTYADAFDVIVSADTLVYFGDLGAVTRAACQALRPGGHLIFTVEHAAPEPPAPGYVLAHHGRYVHGESYVKEVLQTHGLSTIAIEHAQLRTEHLKPVAGLVVTARRNRDHGG